MMAGCSFGSERCARQAAGATQGRARRLRLCQSATPPQHLPDPRLLSLPADLGLEPVLKLLQEQAHRIGWVHHLGRACLAAPLVPLPSQSKSLWRLAASEKSKHQAAIEPMPACAARLLAKPNRRLEEIVAAGAAEPTDRPVATALRAARDEERWAEDVERAEARMRGQVADLRDAVAALETRQVRPPTPHCGVAPVGSSCTANNIWRPGRRSKPNSQPCHALRHARLLRPRRRSSAWPPRPAPPGGSPRSRRACWAGAGPATPLAMRGAAGACRHSARNGRARRLVAAA